MLIVNWLNGWWKIDKPRCRAVVHRTQKLLDPDGYQALSDHFDLFPQIYRELKWRSRLSYAGGEGGRTILEWSSEGKLEAVRVYLMVFVTNKDGKVKHRLGAGWIPQIAKMIGD